MLQREIPEYVNAVAARVGKEAGAIVLLDMGGRDEPMTTELLRNLDIISPNEVRMILLTFAIDWTWKSDQQKDSQWRGIEERDWGFY